MKRKKWLSLAAFAMLASMLVMLVPVAGAQPAPVPNQATGWNVYNPGFPITVSLNAVAMAAANDVWTVGDNSTVYHFNGSNWSPVTSGLPDLRDLNSVSPIPGQPGMAWVVGSGIGGANPSTILKCNAATLSCTQDTSAPTTGQLDGVWAVSATDAWAVGGGASTGIILHYDGSGWVLGSGTFPQKQYHNVQMVSSTEGWAVGEPVSPGANGTVLHYTNGSWQDVTASIPFAYTSPLISLSFISSNEGWLVGGNPNTPSTPPTIVHYLNGAWNQETAPAMDSPTLFWYVNMLASRTGFAVGNGGQIFQRSPTAGTWTRVFLMSQGTQQPLYGVWVLPDGTDGWAVGGSTPGAGVLIRYGGGTPPPVCQNCVPRAYLPFVRH